MANIRNSMIGAGFSPGKEVTIKPRIVVSISGLEKCGKSHFALTAPGPIAFFSIDTGEEGVLNKFTKTKDVWIKEIAMADEDHVEASVKELDEFKKSYYFTLHSKDVRTIIVDTATELWEILRLARFGRLTQVMPYQYGPVNKEYRMLIREAYKYDKNIILLHKMKAAYVNDKKTGDYERAGFADTGFLVQVNAQVYRYAREDGGDFAIYIKDCRQNPDLAGEELVGPMCNFPTLASLVLPDVPASAWEV